MILTCPACAIRYRVADSEFEGLSGRTVRCANCGYLWREPAPAQPPPESLESPAVEIFESTNKNPPTEAASRLEIPSNSQPPQPRGRSFAGRTATIAVLIIAAVIAWVFVRGHFAADHPVTPTPRAAADHAPANARSQTGLIIRKVSPARTTGRLVVEGEIANSGNVSRDVPHLRMVLRDAAEKEVQSETVAPPKARLAPGEVVHFEIPFAHPPDTASGVMVSFAPS